MRAIMSTSATSSAPKEQASVMPPRNFSSPQRSTSWGELDSNAPETR